MQTYKDHVPVLDSLRGFAAVLVVFTHIHNDLLAPVLQIVVGALRPGYLAMEIFFVLSGFLITRILLADRARGKPLKHFLIRRFLRIFPIYYLFLAFMLIWNSWDEVKWCFVYLANFRYPFHHEHSHLRHTWSLCVEEHFYLFWAFAVYGLSATFCKWGARVGFAAVALISALITLDLLPLGEAKRLMYMGTMFRALGLALGASFAFSEHAIRQHRRRSMAIAVALVVVGQMLVQIFLSPLPGLVPELGVRIAPLRAGGIDLVVRMFAFTMVSGGVVLGCLCLKDARGAVGSALRCPPLQYIGRISYSWYLFHVPLFDLMFEWIGVNLTGLIAAIVASLAAASVSFYCIERPILRLKTRFA